MSNNNNNNSRQHGPPVVRTGEQSIIRNIGSRQSFDYSLKQQVIALQQENNELKGRMQVIENNMPVRNARGKLPMRRDTEQSVIV
jgi:hypothetical protein